MALKVTLTLTGVKTYLRVDVDEDDELIGDLQASAISEAEEFLNTDFPDAEGVPQEAPAPVKTWVLNRIAELYENRGMRISPDFSPLQKYRVYPMGQERSG